MKQFSMGNAWSQAFRFVAGRRLGHAIVLVGLGLLVPLALEVAMSFLVRQPYDPASLGSAATWSGPGGAVLSLAMAALALTFILQTASYFASWRLGLARESRVGGAILYGLLGGLLALAVLVLVGALAALVAQTFWSSSVAFLAILLFLLPVFAALALFYTMPAVLIASGLSLVLALAMLFGSVTGQVGMAATMTGGSGGVAVMLLVLSMVTIWIAARLSCTTSLMADRRSLNLVAAVRESWRLTWDEQWAITRYLALLGFGLAILFAALLILIGAGAGSLMSGAASRDPGLIGYAVRLAVQAPLAFLFVMVPAGIYREVAQSDIAAEIFA